MFILNNKKQLYFLLLFFASQAILANNTQAYIVINEIYPKPSSDETEWVELYNVDTGQTSPQSLQNWELWDELSQPSLIFSFSDQSLEPNEYLVVQINSKLNNSGDGVSLKDSNGSIVDSTSYSSGNTGESIARIPNGIGQFSTNLPSKNLPNIAPTPTPIPTPSPTLFPSPTQSVYPSPTPTTPHPTITTSPTQTPTPSQSHQYPTMGNIILSEIMACPESGGEWIELYNQESTNVSLTGWSLWDSQNKIFTFTTETISANNYISVDIIQKLNNSGDSVSLINAENSISDEFSYQDCIKGENYILSGDEWHSTTIPTRDLPNISLRQNEVDGSNSSNSALLSSSNKEKDVIKDNTTVEIKNKKKISSTTKTIEYEKIKKRDQEIADDRYDILKNITLSTSQQQPRKLAESHLAFLPSKQSKDSIVALLVGGIIMVLLGGYNLVKYYGAKIKTLS